MSSRRSFLGAAAALLSLPTAAAADAGPGGSNPGGAEPTYNSSPPSSTASARIAASTTVEAGDGSVRVRSIRFCREEGTTHEAEVVTEAHPIRLTFSLDEEATRQLRDALRGEREDGPVGGTVEMFAETPSGAAGSLAVIGDRFCVETDDVDMTVVLDEEVRADLAGGLDAALDEPAVVEE